MFRGSTDMDLITRKGSGLGGQDRLDHVHAMKVLGEDRRIDTSRSAVVGRSYGGDMTLDLGRTSSRIVDGSRGRKCWGSFDLLSFLDCIPPTWKSSISVAVE